VGVYLSLQAFWLLLPLLLSALPANNTHISDRPWYSSVTNIQRFQSFGEHTVFTVGASAFSFARFSAALSGNGN